MKMVVKCTHNRLNRALSVGPEDKLFQGLNAGREPPMKNSGTANRAIVSASVLMLVAFSLPIVEAQSSPQKFELVAVVLAVDAESNRLKLSAMGEEKEATVVVDARIMNDAGQRMPKGLKDPDLKNGTEVTLSVEAVNGKLTVTAIRLGRHAPVQRRARGSSIDLKPLTEFSIKEAYFGEDGGLYGGGMNSPPETHLAAAKTISANITPLNTDGEPAKDGVIGLISVSMSNARMEFAAFKELADQDSRKSPQVAIVNCAQNGQAMAQWVDPNAKTWTEADRRLSTAGLSPKQVQVAWVKLANIWPMDGLSDHGRKLYDDTVVVLHNAKKHFPNLKIVYLGSRIFAGLAPVGPAGGLNPEPYAYETAFVVRWLIRDQIKGEIPLRYTGEAQMPLLLWGPYLWADGMNPRRSDGLVWKREDIFRDGVHPSNSGCKKVADLLLDHFTTESLAKGWFTNN